jgi:hypothetical protein
MFACEAANLARIARARDIEWEHGDDEWARFDVDVLIQISAMEGKTHVDYLYATRNSDEIIAFRSWLRLKGYDVTYAIMQENSGASRAWHQAKFRIAWDYDQDDTDDVKGAREDSIKPEDLYRHATELVHKLEQ